MSKSSENPYERFSVEETLSHLKTDMNNGLSSDAAKNRLEEYGPNSLETKEESLWKKLFSFFWGPIPIMIEIAAILSLLLEKWPDLIVILTMLIINAALGFFQEYKAGNAIAALKEKLALSANVLRDGSFKQIHASELVPGDIIQIQAGNIIPADVKLLKGEYLSVDQSALTGESLAVSKKVADTAYSGTIVKMGEMIGAVTSTGMKTFFGKTAKLVGEAKTKSHFQQAVVGIGNFLILTTLTICGIILLFSLYRLEVTHKIHEDLGQIIIFILVLVVAGIPVALPAVLSATMAIGANRLASLKAIVSKLTAIEELASMDILCSDKTGTLTKNQLTTGIVVTYNQHTEAEVMETAALASNPDALDPIDIAIFAQYPKEKLSMYTKEKFVPFDPVSKRTEAEIKTSDGNMITVSKGAPQIILKLCKPDEAVQKKVMDAVISIAQKGYRTLGVAKSKADGKWEFLGLIPLFDPPRDDTKETLERVQTLGVSVKMITGDHEAIAKELAEKLNLGTNILPVSHLYENANEPTSKRDHMIENADGFAEVFPDHKFEIVKTLQRTDHVVGMTGDGVNDAPALKQADIGIAVSGATDAAKEAADLVLTEKGLSVIYHAIEEARRIFGRMKSYTMYRITETCRLLLFLSLAMIVFNDHPLSAIMVILIALLNDIPIMMIAYDHMRTHSNPVTWNMKEILTISIGLAVIGVISTFGLFWIGMHYWFSDVGDPVAQFASLRTLSFMGILCGGNLTIYLTRNVGPIWQKPLPEWKFFLATLFSLVIGTLSSVYGLGTPDFVGIGWKFVGLSWAYILLWFVLSMLVKEGLYRILGYKKTYFEEALETTTSSLHPFHQK